MWTICNCSIQADFCSTLVKNKHNQLWGKESKKQAAHRTLRTLLKFSAISSNFRDSGEEIQRPKIMDSWTVLYFSALLGHTLLSRELLITSKAFMRRPGA
uniref:Uncharacterized protein n=1 Tax=Sphaerodactylus townsendi TaxID=933632 RepID=A0ACB8FZL1_9SAUR